jgi:hypothetical protein
LRAKKSNSVRKRAHADASEYKRAVGRPLFFEAVEKLTFFEPPLDKNHAFGRIPKKKSRLAGRIPFASQVFDLDLAIKQTKPAHKEKNLCMCRFSLAAKKNTGVSAPDCTQAAFAAAFCRGNSAVIPPMD